MATKNSEIKVVIEGEDRITPELKKIESGIIRAVGAISATLAGIKIGTAPILAAAQFERELANVAKTTDFTVGQMNELSDALLTISRRIDVSAVDLAKIAAAAGQQGLGRQGVAGVIQFTDSVSRMASVLDITAEEAAVNVGKIINIFKIPLAEVEKAVSVFNEVSNRSTAEGEELLDVVKRIGDAAGALNLQQSTALAATGLDFGISPEVVGTAISRVFSAAFEKAEEFGKLMNISATEWTNRLRTDGLGAFKQFLSALRGLETSSQQRAIVKLVGGGRIGALLNKLVQDTTDSVLTKNFEAAKDGLSGLSAIKEQSKVLDTLDARTRILANSFVKLGIDSAQQLLEPLKQYADELSDALEAPAVKSFVKAAVAALGDLLKLVANVVKTVADLNINWENFLGVLKAFLLLKIGQSIVGIIGGMRFMGVELRSLGATALTTSAALDKTAASAEKAGKVKDAGAAQYKAGLLSRMLGLQELSLWYQKVTEDTNKQAAAEKALQSQQKAAPPPKPTPLAKAAPKPTDLVVPVVPVPKERARVDDIAATKRLRKAELQSELQAELDQQRAKEAIKRRMEEFDKASLERQRQAALKHQTDLAAANAAGNSAAISAAERAYAATIAQETRARANLLARLEEYYAQRLILAKKSQAAELALASTAVATRTTAPAPAQAPRVFAGNQGPDTKSVNEAIALQEALQLQRKKTQAAGEVQARAAADQQAKLNAAVTAEEQRNKERLLAIEQGYRTKYEAIKATGTEVGLKAARRERKELLAEQASLHTQSLANLQTYHQRYAKQQEAAIARQVQAQSEALARLEEQAAKSKLGAVSPALAQAPQPIQAPVRQEKTADTEVARLQRAEAIERKILAKQAEINRVEAAVALAETNQRQGFYTANEQAAQAHAEKLAKIDLDYAEQKARIVATGTTDDLLRARQARDESTRLEKASYAASLQQRKEFYEQENGAQKRAHEQRLAQEKASLRALEAERDKVKTQPPIPIAAPPAPKPVEPPPLPKVVTDASKDALSNAELAVIQRRRELQQAEARARIQAEQQAAVLQQNIAREVASIEQQSSNRKFAIEQNFQAQSKLLRREGQDSRIADLRKTIDAELAAENAARLKSIANVREQYAERAVLERQSLEKESALRKAAVDQAVAEYERLAAVQAKANAAATVRPTPAAPVSLADAEGRVEKQRALYAAAKAREERDTAALQQRLQTALIERERQGNAARLQIQRDFETRRQAIAAGGTKAGLDANQNALEKALRDQAAAQAASLQETRAWYARRLADQKAALAAEVQDQRNALAQALRAQRAAQRNPQALPTAVPTTPTGAAVAPETGALAAATAATAALGTAAQNTSKAINETGNAAAAAAPRIGILTRAAGLATAAMGLLGAGIRTVMTVASRLVSAFFWVTLVYSILDMIGALDKLTPALQKLTDWMGLTSKATRDQKVANEQAEATWKKQREELENFTQAYREALDATNLRIDPKKITEQVEIFRITDDPQKKKDALTKILAIIDGARAQQADIQNNTTENLQRQSDAQTKILEKAVADRERLQAQLDKARADFARATPNSSAAQSAQQRIDINTAGLEDANKRVAEATAKLDTYRQGIAGTSEQVAALGKDISVAFQTAGGLFTTSMIDPLEQIVIPLIKAREESAALTKVLLEDIPRGAREAGVSAEVAAAPIQAQIIKNNQLVAGLTEALKSYAVAVAAKPGVTPQEIAAAQQLVELAQQRLTAVIAVTEQLKLQPKAATGKSLGPPAPPSFGTGTFTKDKEGEARKFAKAQLELARARIQAENALADEQAKQELKRDERRYERGLMALGAYFDSRERVRLAANARDISDKGLEILEVDAALKDKSLDRTARVQFETQKVRLQGQIAVLKEQRKDISEENARERADATREFNQRILNETAQAFRDGIIPASAQRTFKVTLDLLTSQYEDFIAQLRQQGEDSLADALVIGFNVEAYAASIQQANARLNVLFEDLQQKQDELALLRENNELTTLEAQRNNTLEINRQIPLMEQQLQIMREQLAVLAQTAGTDSTAYQQQAQAVDALILRLRQLAQETDRIARDLNKGFTDSLEDALNNLEPTFESLKQNILQFLKDITDQVKGVFAKQIAEAISQSLGNIGTEGFGGFFQKFINDVLAKKATEGLPDLGELGINTALVPTAGVTKAATDASLTTTAATTAAATTTGAATTAAQILVAGATQAAAALSGGGAAQAAAGGVSDLGGFGVSAITGVEQTAESTAAAAATTALSAVAVAGDASTASMFSLVAPTTEVSVGFASMIPILLEVFAGLTSIVAPAVQAAVALEAVAASAQVSAVTSLVAHSGGVIGRSPLRHRKVHPAIFTNAVRYHNGGIAGLKPNEVPTILQKGETVLTAQQAAAQKTADNSGTMSIRNVLVTDPSFVPDAMATAQGEKVLTTFIQRNKPAIRQMLGI